MSLTIVNGQSLGDVCMLISTRRIMKDFVFCFRICPLLILAISSSVAVGDDWPTYRHDLRRSGFTPESIDARRLQQHWVLEASQSPRPAWPGPAKWDAYAYIRGLRSMRDYDNAFQVVVVGSSLLYGSSADDAVHCIDVSTGKERWTYITDAPIRIAPSVVDGLVYFGSDDGHAYCVEIKNGNLVWKSAQIREETQILNNGRLISRWPCRTGVVVHEGTAYFGLSLLPWRESFLIAVDSKTGQVEGSGRFVRTLKNQTLEGGLLVEGDKLIALRGRVSPYIFSRTDGANIGDINDGGGGVIATLNDKGELLHGPGNKTGWITHSSLETQAKIHRFDRFTNVVPLKKTTLFLSDNQITVVDSATNKNVWENHLSNAMDLIVAGSTAFVGTDGGVIGINTVDGKRIWESDVHGRVRGIAAASKKLFVTTDEGAIYCFREGTHSVEPMPSSDVETSRIATAEPLTSQTEDQNGIIGQWTFHSGLGERARRRGFPNADRRVDNKTGTQSGLILGNVTMREVGGVEALELDGTSNSILVAEDHSRANLPQKAITAEAWVRVDVPLRWGGIIGAIQDNGAYERGWLLGYIKSQFCFAVAGSMGPGQLTYLPGKTEFQPQTWYHVVGTYDGKTQRLYVNGQLEASSTLQKGEINYPPKAPFEMGAYHDQDEYYRMTGMLHEALIYNRVLTPEEVTQKFKAKHHKFSVPIRLAKGPYAQFTTPDQAVVRWSTAKPSPTILELSGLGETQRVFDAEPKTDHTAVLTGLRSNSVGDYVIKAEMDGKSKVSQRFQLDSSFNYNQPALIGSPNFSSDSQAASDTAKRLLDEAGIAKGICLVLGLRDASLAFELARQSEMNVICVDTDKTLVNDVREKLSASNSYGTRFSVRHVHSFSELPFIGQFANLIVSERPFLEGRDISDLREMYRLLRPFGGVALFERDSKPQLEMNGSLKHWLDNEAQNWTRLDDETRQLVKIVRPAIQGSGEWSHLYGRADNSAFGGETLAGASSVGDLEVQWIGRPGPRAQPDRSGRKPSPLSKNGRLFVQGLHRVIGVDALNGMPLWSLEIPQLERFNMPRDCGNWCADDEHVYIAVRDHCWKVNAQTGDINETIQVINGNRNEWKYDWSYVARVGDALLGSAVKQGTAFTNFWGNADAGWYDARNGAATFKVCSENLFALNPNTREKKWVYANGVILNSTITATAEFTYFVECRHSKVKASTLRRIGIPELWQDQFLVALDTQTGETAWEVPINTVDGIVVFYMAKGGDQLILTSSSDRNYNVYAFDSKDGTQVWEQSFGWLNGKGDHGKAMSRPAIVGNTVYVRPQTLDLKTGEILPLKMPGGGCGTYAATTNALFFRSGNVTAWNRSSGGTTSWSRLRPGCWLSTVPANGLLLSPEAGGGCSCGSWLESSIGFIPKLVK